VYFESDDGLLGSWNQRLTPFTSPLCRRPGSGLAREVGARHIVALSAMTLQRASFSQMTFVPTGQLLILKVIGSQSSCSIRRVGCGPFRLKGESNPPDLD
jgi:hypothetical protein